MVRRAGLVLGLWAAAAGCIGAANASVRVSAPLPPLGSFVLAPSDFHSGAVLLAGGTEGQIAYRVFKPGARLGAKPLGVVVSIAIVEADASTAQFDFTEFELATKTASGRKEFVTAGSAAFAKGLTASGKTKLKELKLTAGLPVDEGSTAMMLPLTIKTNRGTLHGWIVATSVDRVLGMAELLGNENASVAKSDAQAAVDATRRRLTTAFTVSNAAAPTISGSSAVGQTLTADAGAWNGAPTTFAYGWSRCDATGASCQSIPGATTSTYQLGSADAGSTIVVTATGTNSVGSASATSTPTGVVSS